MYILYRIVNVSNTALYTSMNSPLSMLTHHCQCQLTTVNVESTNHSQYFTDRQKGVCVTHRADLHSSVQNIQGSAATYKYAIKHCQRLMSDVTSFYQYFCNFVTSFTHSTKITPTIFGAFQILWSRQNQTNICVIYN